jgi:2-iminobutanoate/2-iminopropanoate deaminase
MKQVINPTNAPAPIGPYSRAIKAGNMLYTSGSIALDEAGNLYIGDIKTETKLVMENLNTLLVAAGTSFSNVVKTSIFIADMNDFAAINEVYASYFTNDFPARETVQVARLPKDARIEISMIALV